MNVDEHVGARLEMCRVLWGGRHPGHTEEPCSLRWDGSGVTARNRPTTPYHV